MLNELHNEEMPGKKAMIVISNGKSMKNNGWIDEVIDELEQAGVESVVFDKRDATLQSLTLWTV